jgi:hypothetical protein
MKRKVLATTKELQSVFFQSTANFLKEKAQKQLSVELKEMSIDKKFEYIMNDDEVIREFTCYLLSVLTDFLHHPENVNISDN